MEHDNTLISLDVCCNYFQTGLKITMLTHCQKPDNMDTTKQFLEIQNVFTGMQSQTGPLVDNFWLVLDMHFSEKHGNTKILDKC